MSGVNDSLESRKNYKPLLIGIVLLAAVALASLALVGTDDVNYHLETANNILRRWSCPPGGYPAGPGSRGKNCLCLKCPPGHKCVGGHRGKQPCGPGTYQNLGGQNSCKPAPPGTYVSGNGATAGTPCQKGTYNNRPGQRRCTPASPGNYVPSRGSRGQTPCPVGKYQNLRGQASCKPARKGTYVNKRGATSPTPCHYGSYQNVVGQTSCKPTPPGTYANRRGQTNPTRCGANTFQHCSGQMRCIPCAPGFQSVPGSRRCLKSCGVASASFSLSCPPNRYRLTRGAGISGNLLRGPISFTGRASSTLTNSVNTFPRGGGSLSVIVKMRFNPQNRHDWVAVVNKLIDGTHRRWSIWVHPNRNGKGMQLLLQRYTSPSLAIQSGFNLASGTSVFTLGFSCDTAKNRGSIYINGNVLKTGPCRSLNGNGVPVRVGGRHGVHSFLHGTIYQLSMFNEALCPSQMKALMAGGRARCLSA